MTILKCKMCGGDLNFEEGATVVECEYCGTKQTVPTIDDEKKITLFGRANRLRFACEFDKAAGIYENIVADFPEEAEAYWGLVLCKYGIEYVDDPATGKKIPTCHRSSFDSVMEDDNFEQVLENADPIARSVYREEAKQIEELRRGIIEVSNKEEPYDIFICYKETAENGERTIDSVIAQDVYNELTEKGYRVFFSRITLEDKLGQEYEPYIFAALNSAKVMLAFGTDYEYYNAVWVKNEWSRFLQLIAKGEKKTLIPCYKNIDAYDMPKEFARLQAQDMGKVGAMQDLLRGIEKLLPRKESEQPGKETGTVQQAQSATIDSLLKRAFMYLEDGDWKNAADYCNRVLDIDPENAEAYVGLLMAELQVRRQEALKDCSKPFDARNNYRKALSFADSNLANELKGYISYINERNEKARINGIYQNAVSQMNSAQTESEFKSAAGQFKSINGFQDADALAAQCLEKAKIARKDYIYTTAKSVSAIKGFALENIVTYEVAIKGFESISGWRDADEWAGIFRQKIEETKLWANEIYNSAVQLMNSTQNEKEFTAAANQFKLISNFKDADSLMKKCLKKAKSAHQLDAIKTEIAEMKQQLSEVYNKYRSGKRRGNVGVGIFIVIAAAVCMFCSAFIPLRFFIVFLIMGIILIETFFVHTNKYRKECYKKLQSQFTAKLNNFVINDDKEANDRLAAEVKAEFHALQTSEKKGKMNTIVSFIVIIGIVAVMIKVVFPSQIYKNALSFMEDGKYQEAIAAFKDAGNYKDAVEKAEECIGNYYQEAVALMEHGDNAKAAIAFGNIEDYKDAAEKAEECKENCYQEAVALMEGGDNAKAAIAFGKMGDYKDAVEQCYALWDDTIQLDTVSAGGFHTVGLKLDGKVVAVGDNSRYQRDVYRWTDIIAVSAGNYHTVGLKSDRTVVAIGNDEDGQCNVSNWTGIIAVSAGSYHTVGLKSDRTVVAVGEKKYGRCNVSKWESIIAVSAGDQHTVGLKSDGTVVAVGRNNSCQCDVSDWTDIIAISAGNFYTVGLKSDGTVVAVGANYNGQCDVSDWTDIIAVSAGTHHTVGLKADGTVVVVGNNEFGECDVSGWTNIVAVSADSWRTIGLKSDGTVVAVGDDRYGQCDVSNWTNIKRPD